MARAATIDVGTNSVLLLVAERDPDGGWQAASGAGCGSGVGLGAVFTTGAGVVLSASVGVG